MPITVAAAKICRLFKKGLLCFPHFFCGLKLASTVKKIEEPKLIAALQQVGPFLFCTSASLASVSRNFLHAISGPSVLSVPQHGEQFNFFSVNKNCLFVPLPGKKFGFNLYLKKNIFFFLF